MDFERAKAYLTSLASYTDRTSFTGGEALLYHREVTRLTAHARDLGLHVSLVTGAGWVRTEPVTRRRIGELADAGLERIAISWDVYHEEFSLCERAVLLARVAVDAGIHVTVRTVRPANGSSSDYRAAFADVPVQFETSSLARLGRAASLPQEHFLDERSPIRGACNSVLSALVDYDGRVYACCGPSYFSTPHSPLVLGNAEEEPLEQILERAIHDPVLEVISLLGPYGLYLLLKESDARDLYRERTSYSSICDLCLDLTNSMEIVAAIRDHITDSRAQALLTAARMLVGREASEPEPVLATR